MNWFGPSWDAPCCEPENEVPTPSGAKCIDCGGTIRDMDQGLVIPRLLAEGEPFDFADTYWHLNCFLRNIGLLKEKNP